MSLHRFLNRSGFAGLLPSGRKSAEAQGWSRMSWQEVMRIAGTQMVVSTIAKRIDGNQVEVRQCTEPEKQLSDLYKKLDLTSPPLKRRRKICVVHFSELKKTILENQRVIRI